jgi:hypothetical protein
METMQKSAKRPSDASFSADELEPRTGNPEQDRGSAILASLVAKVTAFNAISVANRAHNLAMYSFDEVRQLGVAARGSTQPAILNLAPTGSGKTHCARAFERQALAKFATDPTQRPVIVVPLDAACTVRRFWVRVLDVLGDEYSERGTEETLRRRAYKCFERFGVQLVIVDEVQHLVGRAKEGTLVTDALKRVLDDGVVALALIGTEEAMPAFRRNHHLANRMKAPCHIRKADPAVAAHRTEFAAFLRRLDQAMVAEGIVDERADLDNPRVALAIMQVADGVLGRAVNLVRAALTISVRRHAPKVEIHDLWLATRSWAVEQRLTKRNPFDGTVVR